MTPQSTVSFLGGGVKMNQLLLRPLDDLLYQPWMMMMMMMSVEQLVEILEGETEVLGENLPQCSFVQYKSHMTRA
jgi:hypothetical protein